MIVVDTSALIAILEEETDARVYADAIAAADQPLISAGTLLEVGIVMLTRRGARAARRVDELIQEAGFQVEAVTAHQVQAARAAYAAYGKGLQRAGLNFGDCFAYALAKVTGLPLLFKGRDFLRTEISAALRDEA